MTAVDQVNSKVKASAIKLILFDLLTALLDSWTVWDKAAGSQEAGRTWRMAYLKWTYECGAYRPYEVLVREAAQSVGMDEKAADRLEMFWNNIAPWQEVPKVLKELKKNYRLGVVTNCSERLGHIAADAVGVSFDVVITSEKAGFYKPDPRPYKMALDDAGVRASEALFVAGSAYDLFGTSKVGLPTFWHNRVGLSAPVGAPKALIEMKDMSFLPQAIDEWKQMQGFI